MGSELVILVMIGIAWFYSEELIGFLQLDRAARMANRKLDRLENESIKEDVEYYSAKKNQLTDEQVSAAMAEKARLKEFRYL